MGCGLGIRNFNKIELAEISSLKLSLNLTKFRHEFSPRKFQLKNRISSAGTEFIFCGIGRILMGIVC